MVFSTSMSKQLRNNSKTVFWALTCSCLEYIEDIYFLHWEDNYSKATISLNFIKMIAKLERKQPQPPT